jgi:hypothetical protein
MLYRTKVVSPLPNLATTVSSKFGAFLICSNTTSNPYLYTLPGGTAGVPRELDATKGPGADAASISTKRLRMAVAGRQTLTSDLGAARIRETRRMKDGGRLSQPWSSSRRCCMAERAWARVFPDDESMTETSSERPEWERNDVLKGSSWSGII